MLWISPLIVLHKYTYLNPYVDEDLISCAGNRRREWVILGSCHTHMDAAEIHRFQRAPTRTIIILTVHCVRSQNFAMDSFRLVMD